MKIDFLEDNNLYYYTFNIPEDINILKEYKKALELQIKNNERLQLKYLLAHSVLFLGGLSIINIASNNNASVFVSSTVLGVILIQLFLKNRNVESINNILRNILSSINDGIEDKNMIKLDFSVSREIFYTLENRLENINSNNKEGNQKTKK